MRIAFDIGGVLSKYPAIFRRMIEAFQKDGIEVHVITDMHDREYTLTMLRDNGLDIIPAAHVHNSDYKEHGEGCKQVILEALGIDVFLDDFMGYLAPGGCPVRLLVMPDATKPYYHDDWKTKDEFDFGRRVKK